MCQLSPTNLQICWFELCNWLGCLAAVALGTKNSSPHDASCELDMGRTFSHSTAVLTLTWRRCCNLESLIVLMWVPVEYKHQWTTLCHKHLYTQTHHNMMSVSLALLAPLLFPCLYKHVYVRMVLASVMKSHTSVAATAAD
jgi:hypothetical protein